MSAARQRSIQSISVRADAGPAIGYGHLCRTLSVLTMLRQRADCRIRYMMTGSSDATPAENTGCEIIRLTGSGVDELVHAIPDRDGPLIVDSYSFRTHHLHALKDSGFCTIMFDDGNRLDHYPVAMMIDYAPGADRLPYSGLAYTRFCLGPSFFPLRKEFLGYSKTSPTGSVKKVLVTFGGSDPDDLTARVLNMLARYEHPWTITAVLGPGYTGEAESIASGKNSITIERDVSDMASIMAATDLAISSAGGTALELAYLGVPTIHLVLCDDQLPIAQAMDEAGASTNMGRFTNVNDEQIWSALNRLTSDHDMRQSMNRSAKALVDGKGADRIADAIIDTWHKWNTTETHRGRSICTQ